MSGQVVGTIVVDAVGRMRTLDGAARALLRLSIDDDVLGSDLHELVHGRVSGHAATDCPIRGALADGLARRGADVLRPAAGVEIAVQRNVEPVLEDGTVTGAVVHLVPSPAAGSAAHDRFLADLERALRSLEDAAEIMTTVTRMLGEHLAVDRSAYAQAEADEDHFTMTGSYARGLPELHGRFAMSDFGAETLRLMRAGEPYVVADAFSDPRVRDDQRRVYRSTGIVAVVCLPLHKGGRFVAAMAVHHRSPRLWTAVEVDLLTTVVARCWESLQRAHAIAALRESERRHREIADVLQRSLLPAALPRLDRLAAATRYTPSSAHARAGGDWYDMLSAGGTRVALVVGDVVGHGPAAAAVMGQLRSALAAVLLDGTPPAAALERLDAFSAHVSDAAGSTCACLTLDWATGELRWALAGHPPVLLVDDDGARLLEDASATGPVLGVRGRAPYGEAVTTIRPGTSVVLYTDGLVERRGENLDTGLDRLAGVAAGLGDRGPDQLVRELTDALLGQHGPADDVALLVVRAVPEPLVSELPAQPTSLRSLRRAVTEWAGRAGMLPTDLEDLQLVLGEAAANAVEHAYPPATDATFTCAVARDAGGGVRVEIRDHGSWRPPPADNGTRGHGLGVMRRLTEDFTVDHGPGGTAVAFRLPPDSQGVAPPAAPGAPGAGQQQDEHDLVVRRDVAPDGRPALRLRGDLDLATRGLLGEALDAVTGPVLVDVTELRYLSSAGVALLVAAAGREDLRPELRVAAGSAPARILDLSRIAAAVPVVVVPADIAAGAARGGTPG